MKALNKKILIGMSMGAVLMVGGLASMASAEERPPMGPPPAMCQQAPMPPQDINTEDVAARIAEDFGVEASEVKAALDAEAANPHAIGHAAMVAKVSGKSFKDVYALESEKKDPRAVEQELGVSPDRMHEEMQGMKAKRMAHSGLIEEKDALALLKDGYQDRDIEMAARLAKDSGKSVKNVLKMKKINNRWEDVADDLGVKLPPAHHGGPGHHGDRHGDHQQPPCPPPAPSDAK